MRKLLPVVALLSLSMTGCAFFNDAVWMTKGAPGLVPPPVSSAGPIWAQVNTVQPLPVVRLVPGDEATVNMTGAVAGARVKSVTTAGPVNSEIVTLKTDGLNVIVRGAENASGAVPVLVDLDTDQGPKSATFLAIVALRPMVDFTFKPGNGKVPAKVFVAGDFNGWNNAKDELKKGNDGVYRLSMPVDPGNYKYKLVIDGEWTTDPGNPKKEEGGYSNSLLSVEGTKIAPITVTPLSGEMPGIGEQGGVQFALPKGDTLDAKSVIVIANNQQLAANQLTIDAAKGTVSWKVPGATWGAENFVSVYARDTRGGEGVASFPFISARATRGPRDEVIYFAFTDRFADGDATNNHPNAEKDLHPLANYMGGDFAGVTKKIDEDYFTKLGVTTIWLAPVNENTDKAEHDALPPYRLFSSYHGYWPVSLTETNHRLGTRDELRHLVGEAHGKRIAVLLDYVANHVHSDNPIVKQHPEWITPLQLPDGTKNIRQFDAHPISTWFDTFMPDINYDGSPEARKMMSENAVYWLKETGADGFRLDAVKHVSTAFWREMIATVNREVAEPEGRSIYTVGETISSRGTINEFLGPDLLNGQFDFPLYFALRPVMAQSKGTMKDLYDALGASATDYPVGAVMSPLIGNHDVIRFMGYADGDIPDGLSGEQEKEIGFTNPPKVDHPESYEKLKLAMAFLLTIPGAPTIYYGDEIGLAGAHDPDNRRMMPWNWDAAQQASYDAVGVLGKARQSSSALRRGALHRLFADDERMAFARVSPEETVLVILSRKPTNGELLLSLPAAWGTPKSVEPLVEKGVKAELIKDQLSVKDGAYSYGVWRVKW